MSRMTADDFVSEVRLSLGGETTETASDNQLLRWINRAYIDVSAGFEEFEKLTTITTASGTAEYPCPATGADDINEFISLVDATNNVPMFPWSRRQYDESVLGDASTTTGGPIYWFVSGTGDNNDDTAKTVKQLTFYPRPAGTYTINVTYRKKPTELVLSPSATSSVLPEPWDDVIVSRAVYKGWAALGDDDKSYKALLRANESARVARKVAPQTASYVPVPISSKVGLALR